MQKKKLSLGREMTLYSLAKESRATSSVAINLKDPIKRNTYIQEKCPEEKCPSKEKCPSTLLQRRVERRFKSIKDPIKRNSTENSFVPKRSKLSKDPRKRN